MASMTTKCVHTLTLSEKEVQVLIRALRDEMPVVRQGRPGDSKLMAEIIQAIEDSEVEEDD